MATDEAQRAFGKKVREARTRAKLTQEALADKAGLHTTYVSSVERGQRNISLQNIVALARALGVSPGSLF